MIPKSITAETIRAAADRIDRVGVPGARASRSFDVIIGDKTYPPKYLLSVASEISGTPLPAQEFITTEARYFLTKHGFEIRNKREEPLPTVADEPVLTLEWLDDDSSGYTDFYPVSWFARLGERKELVHFTRGPRGAIYEAKCDLRVHATTAELDYAVHPRFNTRAGMYLGVQKIVFADSTRTLIARSEWRGPHGAFKPVPVKTAALPSLRSEASATDDLPYEMPEGCASPERRTGSTRFFVRDAKVRDAVLERAKGECEFCRQLGFLTAGGTRYLETHHITALAKDGPDTVDNVIALCANDHRAAHFGEAREKLAVRMLEIVKLRQAELSRKRSRL